MRSIRDIQGQWHSGRLARKGDGKAMLQRTWIALLFAGAIVAMGLALGVHVAAQSVTAPTAPGAQERLATITIDYPLEGSIFPPDIGPPTIMWRDAGEQPARWGIDVAFADGSPTIHVESRGEPLRIGEIDPRCISVTNELPKLTPEQAAAHTWIPDPSTWELIKKHSVAGSAAITITGFSENGGHIAVSSGHVTIQTSKDPVGAPIFYRDVPLMPSQNAKGTINPLSPDKVFLVRWRLRNISEPQSRVVLKDMPTCANCHSFSRDGKTMGMDLDGPVNNKGLYAIVPIQPQMTIRNTDVIEWNQTKDGKFPATRVGFLSQVSPDGKFVLTTLHKGEGTFLGNYYTANFKDYRFVQVFFPIRGILGWYNVETHLKGPLPGADDPRYVQTDGVWSPDAKYLVFARAEAQDPVPPGGKMAEYANDPNELQIKFDLYRIPFNGGLGGKAEAIAGASANGMSNTFPKVSPDGRWIVFVRCRNGQLMRPDSQLYIVPAEGGQARRMRCNTSLMNSWHSFSPNGRWLVFSSKSRSPYTQMYLTHLDEEGNDSPAILIENSTAANRAVNLPEFVNIPPDGMQKISAPAVDLYNKFEHARDLMKKGQYDLAIAELTELSAKNPHDSRIPHNLGVALNEMGRYDEAIAQFKKSLEIYPYSAMTYNNLGVALASRGQLDEAVQQFEKAVKIDPGFGSAYNNLGNALASQGQPDQAIPHFEKALELDPSLADAHNSLGNALASRGKLDQAISHFEKALELNPNLAKAHNNLGFALASRGQIDQAKPHFEKAVEIDPRFVDAHYNLGNALAFKGQLDQAILQFQKALELDPGLAKAHNSLGDALASQGQLDQAILQFQKALELDPGLAKAHNSLGEALASQGQLDQAIPQFEKAVDIDPGFAEAHNNLGNALAFRGQVDQAILHFEKAVEIDPGFADAHNNLGSALASRGQFDQAISQFEKAVEINPGLAEAHSNLGTMLYGSHGRVQEALAQWRQALRLQPDYAPAMIQAAHALAASPEASDRNGAEAVKLAERAVQLNGARDPMYLETLALAYAEAGRFPEAIEAARRALELAEKQNQANLAEALKAQIKLYETQTLPRDSTGDSP